MPNRPVPPLTERLALATGHFLFFFSGVWAVVGVLPSSLVFAADPVQMVVWVAFMFTGIVASYATARGNYLLEYAVLPFMGGGAVIYGAAMFWVVVTGASPGSGLALFLVSSLTCYIIARWVSINRLLRSPFKLLFPKKKREPDG